MENFSFLHLGFMGLLLLAMAVVVVEDARRYIIPNWLNAALVLLYIPAAFLFPADPLTALGAAAIALFLGLGLFALGAMGGGDVKLTFALLLYTGWHIASLQFLFVMAIMGGLLTVGVLLMRRVFAPAMQKRRGEKPLPRLLTRGQPVPYGLAIAPAFAYLLLTGNVPMFAG